MAKVDIVIPVYNEEIRLSQSVERILQWIKQNEKHEWLVVISDNGSTDNTAKIAKQLEKKFPNKVKALSIKEKGRGIALRTAWLNSNADVCTYMDIDLATDLSHIPEIVEPILEKKTEIAFGTRWHSKSQVNRKFLRGVLSWSYNFILRYFLGLHVSDAQSGFKAISQKAAKKLIPLVRNNEWFFDTELLLIAQENGYRLYEVPIRWNDSAKSSVVVLNTIIDYLRNVWLMKKRGIPKIPQESYRNP